jgi:hypothetical protein
MVVFLESTFGSMVVVEGSSEGKELQNSFGGHSFGVSPEKGGVISSYAEVVRGVVDSPVKISATPVLMAEMHELDLMSVSLFRDEEDMRVAVNFFDWRRSYRVYWRRDNRSRVVAAAKLGR